MDRADDLVQDTLLRALSNIHRFEPGTNLNAWLFTILRNLFHSEYRKRRREVEDVDGVYASKLTSLPDQGAHLDMEDFRAALAQLPSEQREALLLVGAQGFSYEEASAICGCAVGTIKSRVNRARTRLAGMLRLGAVEERGPRPYDAGGAGGGGIGFPAHEEGDTGSSPTYRGPRASGQPSRVVSLTAWDLRPC